MHPYFILFLAHATLSYSLNCFNKIWQCAFVFVLLALLTNLIAFSYSAKKAVQTVFFSALLSLILSVNKTYFIHGEPIGGLFFATYLSTLISCGSSAFLCSFLIKNKGFSLSYSSLLAAFCAALLDGFAMAGFFANLYPIGRVSDIFIREAGFKFLYAGLIYGMVRGISVMPKVLTFFKNMSYGLTKEREVKNLLDS